MYPSVHASHVRQSSTAGVMTNIGGGFSAWSVSQANAMAAAANISSTSAFNTGISQSYRSSTAPPGKLSSLLGSSHLLDGPTSAQANHTFTSSLATRQTAGRGGARGVSIQRTLKERERQAKALAGGIMSEGSQRTRGYAAPISASVGGASLSDANSFAMEAKLAAAELRAQQYRERISGLERQLHVALAASKTRGATVGTAAATSSVPIDHFPLPPSHSAQPPTTAASRSLGGRNNSTVEEKQSSPSTAPHSFPFASSAARGSSPPKSRSFEFGSTFGRITTASTLPSMGEISGLHQLLDEYESMFSKQTLELKAVRAENTKLKLQLSLTNSLTGLVERVEAEEERVNAAAAPSSTSDAPSSHSSGGLALPLHNPTLLSAGISSKLSKPLQGVQGAPQWLVELLGAQSNDQTNQQQHQNAGVGGSYHSPFTTQSRVHCRGEALKYVLSTLSPHLNVRDRCLTALLDEFIREHSWLSASFAQQSLLVNALMDHLRKVELGLEKEEEKQMGLEYWKRKEREEQEKKQAELYAAAQAKFAAQQQQQMMVPSSWRPQTSGLVAGSAGAAPSRSPPPSARLLLSRATSLVVGGTGGANPAALPPQRNAPVQVDGGGSACIADGVEWLAPVDYDLTHSTRHHTDDDTVRPFRNIPGLREKEEELRNHQMRFVMGVGIDVPLSALRQEHAFLHDKQNQSRGYSEHPGGIVNLPSGGQQQQQQVVVAAPQAVQSTTLIAVASDARPSSAHSDDSSDDTASANRSRETFRERDGQTHHIPASVRKWSTVDQLDYITSTEYSADASSRKPRVRSHNPPPNASAAAKSAAASGETPLSPIPRDRGVSRAYIQTALGALSEIAAAGSEQAQEEESALEIKDPFVSQPELKQGGTVQWMKEEREKERAKERAKEKAKEQTAKAAAAATAAEAAATAATAAQFNIETQPSGLASRAGPAVPTPLSIPTLTSPTYSPFSSPRSGAGGATTSSGFNSTPTSHPMSPTVQANFSSSPHPSMNFGPPTMMYQQPVLQPLPPPPVQQTQTQQVAAPQQGSSFSLQSEYVPLSSLKLLYELLKFISFKLNHTQQLKHVVHVVRRMVGSDRVTLWFVDHFRQHIWSTIGTAVTNEIRVKLGVGIAGGVAASGKSVTMTNATYDQRFLKKVESGTDYVTKAVMAIPLKTPRNQTFAVLQVMNKVSTSGSGAAGGGYFTRTDELLTHLVCQHLSQNLWSSEMYQIALREKLKTQAVFQHAEQLLSCLDVKEMLTSLIGRVRMMMDADYAVLFALSSNEKEAGNGDEKHDEEDEDEEDEHHHGHHARGPSSHPSNRRSASSALRRHAGDSNSDADHHQPLLDRGGRRLLSRGKRRPAATTTWGEEPIEPVREELLSITESCTPQIAIIIPQGYASDQRGDGFKFNAIRVPISSGGLAAQTVKSGRVVNVYDTRLDPRFNAMTDEYVSDTIGGPGGGGGGGGSKSTHCTRSFVSIPIHGPTASSASSPDGVLILGKLIPKQFQDWEIAEFDELKNIIWMGVRRYRQDRLVNLRLHDRLSSINRMVSHLDLEAGGTGTSITDHDGVIQQSHHVTREESTGASGGVNVSSSIATEKSNVGRMRDPFTGEYLPTIAEYQRNRMLFPSAPQLGSSLADAFYKNELTKSSENPFGTLLGSDTTYTPSIFLSSRASTMDAMPMNFSLQNATSSLADREREEKEMRDPRAPPSPVNEMIRRNTMSRGGRGSMNDSNKPVETLTLQREFDSSLVVNSSTAIAASTPNATDDDPDLEDDEGIFAERNGKKKVEKPTGPIVPAPPPPQPLKPLDYSKVTFTQPLVKKKEPLLPPVPGALSGGGAAAIPSTVASALATPQVSTGSFTVETAGEESGSGSTKSAVPITIYKPHPPSLAPSSSSSVPSEVLDAFHEQTIHSVLNKGTTSGSGGVIVFNDSAGSGFGIAPSSANLVSTTSTVSRIALRNMTDFREVDAMKTVTYGK